MAARFFQGLGVSPASNVGLAVINDLFFEHERGQKVGLWVLAIDLGLLFGPLIGGIINFAGFAWIQWLSAIFFGVILFAELFFLPETLYPRHLMLSKIRRVRARQTDMEKIAVGISDMEEVTILKTKQLRFINLSPIPGLQHPKQYDAVVRFVKTFQYTVIPLAIITYCFGWYWWLLSIITLVPVAYAKYPPHIQGLLYLGLIFGTLVSEFCCSGGLSDRIVIKLASQNNKQKTPEMRIWLSYPAALLSAVGLIIWGISIDYDYHWMVGEFAFALFGAGIQMGNTAICSFVMDAYPMQSMATMTFYAVMLNLSAFAEPFFIVPWVENVGFTWTFAGQAFITLFFCVPVMVLIHRFGGVLREKSGRPTWVNSELEYSTAKS
ncbi:hypothetical protein QQS21_006794 [Conoideocrella luteorostrata]|uniref:MFS transporter n=1 Tax=Conoideocrella luteorostrata TaxID=1105319 RepID=A0AAJ0FXL9_9HYPO|nr:hypothetical protein QQS21_006794 [Conoideocrella luteorostrata]